MRTFGARFNEFGEYQSRNICFYDLGIPEALAIAGTVASTAITAYGASQAADAQSKADSFNAEVAAQQAKNATDQANAQAQIDEQNTRRQLGQISADYGAAGVDPNQGTAAAVLSDQSSQGELTKQITLYQGKLARLGDLTQGQIYSYEGAQAQAAGMFKAGSTILTGAGTVAKNWPNTW
jgi:hypothetical protein